MKAKVIAIASQKGGVAKSTTTIELATCFSLMGKKVLVIDFDSQNDTTLNLGGTVNSKKSIVNVFRREVSVSDVIQHGNNGVDIITGTDTLSLTEVEFSTEKDFDNIYLLLDVCDYVRDQYDFILIDNNPFRGLILNMTYVAADYIICPTKASEDDLRAIVRVNEDLEKYKKTRSGAALSHAEIIAIIITQFKKVGNEYGRALQKALLMAQRIGSDVLVDTVRDGISVMESKGAGVRQSLQIFDKNCSPARDYRRIAEKIIDLLDRKEVK